MSLLHPIRLAFSCPMRWDKLTGGDQTRHCAACDQHVHDLSAMSRVKAQGPLDQADTPICVRIGVEADGRGRFQPVLPGLAASGLVIAAAVLKRRP